MNLLKKDFIIIIIGCFSMLISQLIIKTFHLELYLIECIITISLWILIKYIINIFKENNEYCFGKKRIK